MAFRSCCIWKWTYELQTSQCPGHTLGWFPPNLWGWDSSTSIFFKLSRSLLYADKFEKQCSNYFLASKLVSFPVAHPLYYPKTMKLTCKKKKNSFKNSPLSTGMFSKCIADQQNNSICLWKRRFQPHFRGEEEMSAIICIFNGHTRCCPWILNLRTVLSRRSNPLSWQKGALSLVLA